MSQSEAITKAVGVLRAFGDDAPIRNRKEFADGAIDALTALLEQPAPVEVSEELVAAAYVRGAAWMRENPDVPEYVNKAARDYADNLLSALQPSPARETQHDPRLVEGLTNVVENLRQRPPEMRGPFKVNVGEPSSPAREEAEALVKRLQNRALARLGIKKPSLTDKLDAALDNTTADFIARHHLGEKL